MGLTSALNTSLNGLALNENTIDVLGNNIANAGTNGFKASTVRFQTQLSRTMSVGSRPTASAGGTNPRQVGLGATVSVISRDFTQGSVSNSTSPSDLAIQGNGFFVMNGANGLVYTRNGNFSLNSGAALVNDQGMFVQGYGVDRNFNLVTTQLSDLHVPLGDLHVAQQTTNLEVTGGLLPTGAIGNKGSLITSQPLYIDNPAAIPVPPLIAASSGSNLVDLKNADGLPLFTEDQIIQFTPQKGGGDIAKIDFVVEDDSTVQDFMTYIEQTLAIQSDSGIPDDGRAVGLRPGVTLNPDGSIKIVGNTGTKNDIDASNGSLTANSANNERISFFKSTDTNPLLNGSAVGESSGTNLVLYDSLGQKVNARVTMTLESVSPGKTTFRWYVECAEDAGADVGIANGTIDFDVDGKVINGEKATISLDRSNTAAASPMQVTLDFSKVSVVTEGGTTSTLNPGDQDGAPPGTLQNFVIDEGGIINGVFDNGMIRTLGQITLARFANPDGLVEDGSTTFKEGVSSGSPFFVAPNNFGVGSIRAGAIELSNTDIGKGLVDLIVASTNYRGNARVISSVQNLVDELLQLGR